MHFKGFHRIEALMYRDGVTAPAKGFAKELKKSARDLDAKLKDKNLFDAAVVLGNAAGLAEEIAAKKISSEEETYSDLSNVIFANNFKGIRGVVTPFKDLVKAETWAAVESALNAGDAATQGLYTDITNGETYTLYSKTSFEQRYNIQKAAYSLNAAIDNVAAELNIALPDDDPEPACTPTISKTEYPGTSAEIQGDSTSGVVYFQALAKEMESRRTPSPMRTPSTSRTALDLRSPGRRGTSSSCARRGSMSPAEAPRRSARVRCASV